MDAGSCGQRARCRHGEGDAAFRRGEPMRSGEKQGARRVGVAASPKPAVQAQSRKARGGPESPAATPAPGHGPGAESPFVQQLWEDAPTARRPRSLPPPLLPDVHACLQPRSTAILQLPPARDAGHPLQVTVPSSKARTKFVDVPEE